MLIDVSMPIRSGSAFRRGSPPVEITTRQFYHPSEGHYEAAVLSFPAHTATHIDLVFRDRRITPEQMIGPGTLIDATQVHDREILLGDVAHQVEIAAGHFVFFRTDWSQFAGSDRYFEHPELSLEVVQWLASARVNAVGIDALGLGRDARHRELDRLLAQNDILVIENLTNLSGVPKQGFTVYCFPLRIEALDAIPARVVVEVSE